MNILEIVPKAKLYTDLALFANHAITAGIIATLSVIIIICTFLWNNNSNNGVITIFTGLLCIGAIFIASACIFIAIIDNPTNGLSNSVNVEHNISINLSQLHKQEIQEKYIHNPLVKRRINYLIATKEYYDDTHTNDIKPPLIQHKFF